MEPTDSQGALRVTLDVWHPNCWVLETTEQADVGLLGYGVYARPGGRATQHCTVYGDTQAAIQAAIDHLGGCEPVRSVSELTGGFRYRGVTPPGNASRRLLVEHESDTQMSEAFTARGFAYAVPADAYRGTEHWTLLSNDDRETIKTHLEDVREEMDADISVEGIARADHGSNDGPAALPLERLTGRQREVFRLARTRGYYAHPKRATARDLAEELDVTTSTVHEHLHKAEQELLDRS